MVFGALSSLQDWPQSCRVGICNMKTRDGHWVLSKKIEFMNEAVICMYTRMYIEIFHFFFFCGIGTIVIEQFSTGALLVWRLSSPRCSYLTDDYFFLKPVSNRREKWTTKVVRDAKPPSTATRPWSWWWTSAATRCESW